MLLNTPIWDQEGVCVGWGGGGVSALLSWRINRFESVHDKLTSGYNFGLSG